MAKKQLGGLSVGDLKKELMKRERSASALRQKRDRVAQQLRAIDRQLEAMGLPPGGSIKLGFTKTGAPRKRPVNKGTLVDALRKTLKGKTMSVTDLTSAVQKGGYKTTAANFRTIVNQTLIRLPRVFRKVSRGKYTAA